MPYPLRLLSRTSWVVAAMLGTVFCVMTVNLVSVSKSLAQEGKPPAQENEKPKTEAPVADDQKPGKEDKPATEPAKPAQGEDRAAATLRFDR